MLNLFFKVYLNQLCSERNAESDILAKRSSGDGFWGQSGRNVSIIYAGGDDLFIVGAWDDTVELAFDIQSEFERFTWGRPYDKGGISGGLTLSQPKFPLYQMAFLSSEAEAFAKHDLAGRDEMTPKNRIALFFDHSKRQRKMRLEKRGREYRNRYMLSMTWGLAHEFLLPMMKVYIECGKLSGDANERMSFNVDKFSFATVEKWFAVIRKYQDSNFLYLPTMARVMSSIEKEFNDNADIFKRLTALLYTRKEGTETWISHFHIALNWLAYLRRTA
jgi:CRISPR-associated protein Csm1